MIKFENDARFMTPVMIDVFSIGEIHSLIYDLGEDSEVIASGYATINDLARKTLLWFKSRGRLSEVWDAIAKSRPFLEWEITDGSVEHKPQRTEHLPDESESVGEEWELLTELSKINMRIMEITSELMRINLRNTKE